MTDKTGTKAAPLRWLLLVPQLPAKPPYLRVKVWRRLKLLGAISVKNAVHVLPAGDQAREDFEWVLRDIEEGGGDALICEADLVEGLSDGEMRALFDAARDADYAQFVKGLRGKRKDLVSQLPKLRQKLDQIAAIDFFGASGRLAAESLLAELERQPEAGKVPRKTQADALTGKTWVTRTGVHVDRIACAWAVRRFIDSKARFKFVADKAYPGGPGEIRFDMFSGEISHVGDKCSLEVLLGRAGLSDPALTAIAEIVHDIDLKDGKFGREETPGIAHVIAGICAGRDSDEERIARGSAVLEDAYMQFRRRQAR